MRSFLISLLALGACATANAQSNALPPALADAAERYEHAQIAGDGAALQELVADDYVLIGSDGTRQDKSELIAFWTADGLDPNPVSVTEPVELIWNDGAALGGTVTLSGASGGAPFSVTMRYVDVWAFRDGAWRVVYGQVTRATE